MAEWGVPGYTVLEMLGSGGFGEVALARHDVTGTLVAIKYLRQALLSDPGFAGMFRSEAAVLASLDDPNIVRLYEYVESPSGAAIVMELVNGVSLRDILARQGGTSAEAALVVLRGSLLGLAAAHRRGVVHRDYKPENVLVSGDGVSKLTDFGIAARAGDRPFPAGTLHYVAPEQMAGAPASPAGDVYSATATFYESAYVKNLTWSGWGTATATGTGTLELDDCNPSCAQGTFTGYPATVTLSSPAGFGNGEQAYSAMLVSAPSSPLQARSFTTGLVP